jgi:biuret amidohydrolase
MAFTRDARTTLVIVDMVVDSVTGFWPVYNPDETIANVARVRDACYAAGVPVVQLQHCNRPDGLNAVLNESRLEDGVTPGACVPGTPGFEIVDGLQPVDRDIVVRKSRWHGFFGTELASILRRLDTEQILWTGVFTDACLALSVFEGYFHDYPCGLVADAASCTNEFIHKTAVLNMANWVYDLTVFTTPNAERWLAGEDAPYWYAGQHNTLPYASAEDVERMYESVVSPVGAALTAGD